MSHNVYYAQGGSSPIHFNVYMKLFNQTPYTLLIDYRLSAPPGKTPFTDIARGSWGDIHNSGPPPSTLAPGAFAPVHMTSDNLNPNMAPCNRVPAQPCIVASMMYYKQGTSGLSGNNPSGYIFFNMVDFPYAFTAPSLINRTFYTTITNGLPGTIPSWANTFGNVNQDYQCKIRDINLLGCEFYITNAFVGETSGETDINVYITEPIPGAPSAHHHIPS